MEARLWALLNEVGQRLHGGAVGASGAADRESSIEASADPPEDVARDAYRASSWNAVPVTSGELPRLRIGTQQSSDGNAREHLASRDGPDALEDWYKGRWVFICDSPRVISAYRARGLSSSSFAAGFGNSIDVFSVGHDTDLESDLEDPLAARSRGHNRAEDEHDAPAGGGDHSPRSLYGKLLTGTLRVLNPLGFIITVGELTKQQHEKCFPAPRPNKLNASASGRLQPVPESPR